jgi:hypothetical protein
MDGLFGQAAPVVSATPSPVPAPAPSASAAPKRRRSLLGEGPVILTGAGSVDLNTRSAGRNGISQASAGYLSAGQIGMERRTETAVLSLTQGVGYSTGQAAYGQMQVNYRTPTYSLDYGEVSGSGDSQLQIGGFARGIRYSRPLRDDGTIELIAAAAFQQDSTGYRALGVRRFWQRKRSSQALTLIQANALHGTGQDRIADLVLKRFAQTGTATFEAAVSQAQNVVGSPAGVQLALGFGFDRAGRSGYQSFSATIEPNGFTSLNQISLPASHVQALIRRDIGSRGSIAVNFGGDRTVIDGVASTDQLANVSFNTIVRGVGVTLLENLATSQASGISTINRGSGATFNEVIAKTTLSESYQLATVDGGGGLATNRQINFAEARQIFGGYLNLSQSFGSSGSSGSVGTFSDNELAYTRSVGKKFDLGVGLGLQNQTTNGVSVPTATTTVSVTRRLSPVVAVRLTTALSHQGGPTPGTSTSFSADLVGPFAFGAAARASGRINPNLPATIRGRVYGVATPNDFSAAVNQQRGYGNVLVVLDGTTTQRTDSTGAYEFRFVKPGTHSVAIEPASLQAGIIADRARQTFKIQGGQIQSVDFGVGNFAGITGRVYSKINGVETGIANVVVVIDDLQRLVTDEDGRYSVGRLTAGPHRVAVDQTTLPSNAALDGSFAAKVVPAVTGQLVVSDFRTQRLGSISGTVLFTADNGFGDLKGAKDVYVVANPGDHAAITDTDGAFLIDNLPPGKYTLTVDKDTLPEGQDVIQGPEEAVEVVSEAKIAGITFKLGSGPKEVVFTFNGSKKSPISVTTDVTAVPPGGLVRVTVRTGTKEAKSVKIETDAFGAFPLKQEKTPNTWSGAFIIPSTAQKGEFSVHAAVDGDDKGADTSVTIDPKIALIAVRLAPSHPSPGQTVHVVMRALAPVNEGDEVHFPDGYDIKLPKPKGRIFSFDIRLWSKGTPYSGSIVTKDHLILPLVIK